MMMIITIIIISISIIMMTLNQSRTPLEAGYGHPVVRVERSTVRRCRIGFRFGDDYDWGCQAWRHDAIMPW